MIKLVLEKAEEPEIKLPTSPASRKKQESSRKTSISALLTVPKPLTVWITTNYGKFWKRWEYQTTWPTSWEICMQVKKHHGHGTIYWFQIWKGVHQGCILSLCLFNLCAELLLLSHFSRVRLCVTPWTAANQAPPSPGFSRHEHWSGLPFPSPMCESEKWKWSRSVCLTLSDPMDCSLPGSSAHGIFQARVLEWVAIASPIY